MLQNEFLSISFVVVVSIAFLFSANAQTASKDSIKTIQAEEIVLISHAKKNAIGITNSSSISSEVFETFSPLEITNSINQIPGLYALSGAINTNRITIRGVGARTPFGTDKLRMYFNNIPVTNGTGTSTIEVFDLENLSTIEVIKGPKGTHYGANLGGAILLNSKSLEKSETTVVNNFTIGSYGMLKDNISFQTKTDQFSIQLAYNHVDTEGFRENNNFTRNGIFLNTEYKINSKNALGLLLNYADVLAQIPSSISQTAFDENPTQAAPNWLAAQGFEEYDYHIMGIYYRGKLSDQLENATSLFYNFSDNYEARPFNILDESTFGYGFKSQFTGSFSMQQQKASFALGVELYRDEYKWATFRNDYQDNNGNGSLQGAQLSNNKEFRSQLNFSSSFLFPISNKLKAQLNLGFNVTSYDFLDRFTVGEENQSASRSFDPILFPSLSLEYAISPFHNLHMNISRGFSNPSLEETLTPDGLINPAIEQEKGISYELTSQLRFFKNNLSLDVSLYQMNITDLLVAQRVGEDQYIGRNAGKTRHQGFELDANYTFAFVAASTLKPFVRYTLNNHSFVDFVDEDQDYSGNDLTGVPKNKVDAGFYWLFKGLYWNVTYQFVDEIPLTDANTFNSNAFSLFNTKMGYQTQVHQKWTLGLNLGINNLFNEKYARSVLINAIGFGGSEPRYFYPGDNRNYYGSFSIHYQI